MENTEIRRTQLRRIEESRGSRAIAYVTGDRQGAETKIGMDVFPYFYMVLSKIGKAKKIDVLLYSTGGVTMAAWGLANLIREFSDQFSVLVPFKAQSAATLLCLGADEVVMGRLGQLSPVDPSVTSPFNPMAPQNPMQPVPQLLPVSVEDVTSYLSLAREEAELKSEDSILEVFKKLSDTVQPMALGSVYRAKQQIKLLSEQLLAFHMDKEKEKSRIANIIKWLTRELFSHDYLIGRREAKETLKLKVTIPPDALEGLIWEAFSAYAEAIDMFAPYNPGIVLGTADEKTIELHNAFIECTDIGFAFQTRKLVNRVTVNQGPGMPSAVGFQEQVLNQGWVEI